MLPQEIWGWYSWDGLGEEVHGRPFAWVADSSTPAASSACRHVWEGDGSCRAISRSDAAQECYRWCHPSNRE